MTPIFVFLVERMRGKERATPAKVFGIAVAFAGTVVVLAGRVVAWLIYYWALGRAEASRVAIWSNLQPVLTALLAWMMYGEALSGPFVVGA